MRRLKKMTGEEESYSPSQFSLQFSLCIEDGEEELDEQDIHGR
jgi:hypothetical protein